MRYSYYEGVMRDKHFPVWIIWLLLIAALFGAVYFAATYYAPTMVSMPLTVKSSADATLKAMEATPPTMTPHLYLPTLNVDVPVAVGGDQSALSSGAWQRTVGVTPDLQKNLAICAQRFVLGMTPWQTKVQSPFYNLDRLASGEQLYLDYKDKRYAYRVTHVAELADDGTQAEAPGTSAQLTLFLCGSDGSAETGPVVQAKQVGPVTAVTH